MIIDTSAVLAILLGEPEREKYLEAILQSDQSFISAVTYVELSIICMSKGDALSVRLAEQFLKKVNIETAPVSVQQAVIAKEAYRDFGKGKHKAALNLGDCFSYALAKEKDLPLLYKGEDFSKTDVQNAI